MQKVEEKITLSINSSPERVWEVISKVDGVDKWFGSMISSCRVEGGKRYCETADGIPLIEDILEVDHQSRTFQFGIPNQELLPARNIVESMKVDTDTNGKAQVTWSGSFEAKPENIEATKEALRGIWIQGLKDMEKYLNSEEI